MSWLLKLLGSAAGPYLAAGVAVLMLTLSVASCVQTKRLDKAREMIRAEREAHALAIGQCRANVGALTASLDAQNAALDGLRKRGEALTAENARLATAARKPASMAAAKSDRILATPPTGGDVCSRMLDIDRRFTGELQ